MSNEYRARLDRGESVADGLVSEPDSSMFVDWSPFLGHDWIAEGDTGVELTRLRELANKLCAIPDGVQIQRQGRQNLRRPKKMAAGSLPLNWGMPSF